MYDIPVHQQLSSVASNVDVTVKSENYELLYLSPITICATIMIVAVAVGGSFVVWVLYSWLKAQYDDKIQRKYSESCSLRQLDELETFLFELEKYGTGTIGNILCLTSETPLAPTLVTQALSSLTQRHPLLRAKLTVGDGQDDVHNYFHIMDPGQVVIPLTRIDLKAAQWKKAWEELHYGDRFEKDGVLWTATLLQEEFDSDSKTYYNSLIFALHHSIADGISGVSFTKNFVEALNQMQASISDNALGKSGEAATSEDSSISNRETPTIRESLPLLPSAHTLLQNKVGYPLWQRALGLPRLFSLLFQFAIRVQAKIKPTNHLLEAFLENSQKDHPINVQQTIVTRELSEDKTKILVDVAKQNDTTVHGILTAACHVVLCKILRSKFPAISPPKAIDIISAVNIRKECFPVLPDGYLGHYAVPIIISLSFSGPSKNDVLKLAKDCNRNMKKQVDNGSHLLLHKLLETIGGDTFMNISKSLSNTDRVINPQALTNLGRHYVAQTRNQFKISKLFFTVSMIPNNNIPTTMFTNEVVTLNGKLYWVTGYDHTLVGRSQAEEYVSKIFEQIDAII